MTRGSERPFIYAICTLGVLLTGTLSACSGVSSNEKSGKDVRSEGQAGAPIADEAKAEATRVNKDARSGGQVGKSSAGEAKAEAPGEPVQAPGGSAAAEAEVPNTAEAKVPNTAEAKAQAAQEAATVGSILPAGCTAGHEESGPWDGKEQFMLSCQKPGLKGWTKAGTSVDYGAGSAFRVHRYRKDGWMLLWTEVCCSSCDPDGLTDCEPHMAARLYPPSDLKDCKHSQICAVEGLCVQKSGWCEAAEEE